MRGGGSAAIRPVTQQVWELAVSLPNLVTYGAVIILGSLVVKSIVAAVSSSSPDRQKVPPTTPSRTESTTSGSESTADTEQPSADRQSTESISKQRPEAEVRSANETDSSRNSSTGGYAHDGAWSSPTARRTQETRFVSNTPTQATRKPWSGTSNASNGSAIRLASTHSRRNSLLHLSRRKSRCSRTNSRRQLVEGVDVNTGFDWVSTDSTWSVAEVDLGVDGGSVDVGGELIYIDPIPSLADYKLVDSPIDFSPPSILQLLLGTANSKQHSGLESKEQDLQVESRTSGEDNVVDRQQRRPPDDDRELGSISENPPQEARILDELSHDLYASPEDSMDSTSQSSPTALDLSTDDLLLSQPAGSDAGMDKQLGVVEVDSVIRESAFGETDSCSPEFHAKDAIGELNQEIAGLENRLREREQELQEHLQVESDNEYQVTPQLPTFEDFGVNETFLDSQDRLIDPGIGSPGVSESADSEVSFSQEFTTGWEPTRDKRSQFAAEPPSMFSEPDNGFNQADDAFDVDESGLDSGIGPDPSPSEVDGLMPDIDLGGTEQDFGL